MYYNEVLIYPVVVLVSVKGKIVEGADPSGAGAVIHILPVNRQDPSKTDFYLSLFTSPQPNMKTPLL